MVGSVRNTRESMANNPKTLGGAREGLAAPNGPRGDPRRAQPPPGALCAPQRLVVVLPGVLEVPYGSGDNARELRVHGDIRVVIDDVPDDLHLLIEI